MGEVSDVLRELGHRLLWRSMDAQTKSERGTVLSNMAGVLFELANHAERLLVDGVVVPITEGTAGDRTITVRDAGKGEDGLT